MLCCVASGKSEGKQGKSASSRGGGAGKREEGGGSKGKEDGNPFFTNGKPIFSKKYEFKFDGQKWGWVPVGLAVLAGYILSRGSNTRHISWQEFRTQYLERGEVERLQVVDRNVVRVYLRNDASIAKTPGVRVQ